MKKYSISLPMPQKYKPPRDSIEKRGDDIDILLRERLAVFSPASKESDFIMEQVLSKVNMGLIAFG